jgi:chromosome segregation ATPase
MRKKSTLYRLTLGLLLGAMIMPAQTAHAQFGFSIVYDPTNHQTLIEKKIEDTLRFVQIFDNAVKQYTSLKGVLGRAEDLVTDRFISKETMRDIGGTIRASFKLKDQIQAIISTRLTMLKSMDDRLRNGIFDPEADLRDLEDYLRTSIGRSSQDSLANLARLENMDNTLERMRYELKKAEAALSKVYEEKRDLEEQYDRIHGRSVKNAKEGAVSPPLTEGSVSLPTEGLGSLSTEAAETLNASIRNCYVQIAEYNEQIHNLRTEIAERVKKYQVQTDQRIKFGDQVEATNNAWSRFEDLLHKFYEYEKQKAGVYEERKADVN